MIKYFLENPEWELTRATKGAAGYDLRANLSLTRDIAPGERWLVPTGLYIAMPSAVSGEICSRSGMAINHGVIVLNSPGIIDSDYRGEVKVSLVNLGSTPFSIVPGERIAQLVLRPVLPEFWDLARDRRFDTLEVNRVGSKEALGLTDRGAGGHGSTGRT